MIASAMPDAPAKWAPVQKGFVTSSEDVLPYAPDRVMVKFTEQAMENFKLDIEFEMDLASPYGDIETGIASVDAISRQYGVTKVSRPYIELKNKVEETRLGIDRWFRFDVPRGSDVLDIVDRLGDDPNVEYAKPDWRAFPMVVPSDPLYADSWGHNNTAQLPDLDWGGTYDHTLPNTVGTPGFDANAQAAWDVTFGSSSVIVAIIDSGVDIDHPDLTLVTGYDFGDNDSNPDDNSAQAGHGTCCAGVAAANVNNGLGACGIAPNSVIMPLKVANSAGSMYFSSIENALYYAGDNGADIVSISLGAPGVSSDPATDAAIQYAYNAGCVILAATGNENTSSIHYPAINAYVIGVGAASPCGERKRSSSLSTECNPGVSTDPNGYTCDGERWWGSNWGVNIQDAAGAVDVIAPTILPTSDIGGSGGYRSGDYEPFFNGTSCATPYAAGVAALIKAQNPSWTPAQVRSQLVSTAMDITSVESGSGWDRYTGYGMVDAEAAVGGGGPVAPTAAFSGTPTNGDAPLTVTFTDQSSGEPTSWLWNFGDTGTSGAQNPVHTYNNPGTYTVTLTATNAQGSDDEVKTNYITVTEPGSGYATLPYSTGFESGVFDQYWTTNSTSPGQVQITTANTPHSGSYHMTMDVTSSGTYAQNEGWLHLNLAGEGDVELDFWWKDFSDETHSQDGVYFSDNGGSSWVKVQDLNGASYTNNVWNNFTLDVDALASANGLGLTSTFVIKFQQYDNYVITTDGHAYDDISVTGLAPQPPVAAFSGSPTSGAYPLDVQFTDASTGAPTSWSWDFGDGTGTSTAPNPSYTYTAAGTYTVTLTATNAVGSDDEIKTDYITVTEPGTAEWETITYDDFEGGFGNYTDGGGDCYLYTSGTYAHQGSNAAGIQDNSGVASSFYHTNGHDVSGYTELEVDFWYIAISMDRSTEDFWLQYYDGSSWQTIATWAQGIDFNNGTFYHETVTIPNTYNYPTNAQLRFVCDASGNRDDVYIDEIEWRGLTAGGSGGGIVTQNSAPRQTSLAQNFPNPFNPRTSISYFLAEETSVTLEIFDVAGKRVVTLVDGTQGSGQQVVEYDASSLSSGVYFYRLVAGDFTEMKKMVLLK
jgi:PKD repeat protein